MIDSGVECCFCAQNILETKIDPIDITIMANSASAKPENNHAQIFFWGHTKCFLKKLHPKHQGYLKAIMSHKDE